MEFNFFLLYKFVDSLKWVIVIVGLIFYFRNELKALIQHGFSVTHGGTTVNFPQPKQNASKGADDNDIEEITENKTKEELQKLYDDNRSKDNEIFRLKLEKNFEYTYRIIFKSQIILLSNLQAITDGFSQLQLESHLINIKEVFPILKNSTIQQYLKFLFDQNLIQRDDVTNKVKLTPVGDLFLKYVILNQYNYEVEKSL